MKVILKLTHPYTVIASFCFILISGESFGGFYAMYLFMGLSHGAIYSVLALLGAGVLLLSQSLYAPRPHYFIYPLLNVIGVILLCSSLVVFFSSSRGYNNNSFDQTMPVLTLLLFGLIALGFVIRTIWLNYSKPIVT